MSDVLHQAAAVVGRAVRRHWWAEQDAATCFDMLGVCVRRRLRRPFAAEVRALYFRFYEEAAAL